MIMSSKTKARIVLESFTSIITTHIKFIRECCFRAWYYHLYIEESFIMRHTPLISTAFVSIVQEKKSLRRNAKVKLHEVKRKIEAVQKGHGDMSTEDKNSRLEDVDDNKKAVEKFIHENNVDDTDLFIPDSVFDLTPRFMCFLGELSAYGLLAIPACQILLIVFAPFWFMLATFLIPPILITYLILTAFYSITKIFYVQDVSIAFVS